MNCKDYEEKILEILDKNKLSPKILSHISKCKTCLNFHGYIETLKEDLNRLEILEPSSDFNIRVIEKLKEQHSYWKILTFASSFAVFISFLFVSVIAKKYFVQITVFCGEILKMVQILSRPFTYTYQVVAALCFLSVILFIIISGIFDVFLLSKLIKNGGRS